MSSTPAIDQNKSSINTNLAAVNETNQSIAKKTPARSYEELKPSCDSMEEGTTLEHRDIKKTCSDVIEKNKAKLQLYETHLQIGKAITLISTIATLASTLFIIFAQKGSLTTMLATALLCLFITVLLISAFISVEKNASIDRIKTQSHIALVLNLINFESIKKLENEEGENFLINIVENYLGGSIPVNTKLFAKINYEDDKISHTKSNEEKEYRRKKYFEYTKKLIYNFLKILDTSKENGHKETKNYNNSIKEALNSDILNALKDDNGLIFKK